MLSYIDPPRYVLTSCYHGIAVCSRTRTVWYYAYYTAVEHTAESEAAAAVSCGETGIYSTATILGVGEFRSKVLLL